MRGEPVRGHIPEPGFFSLSGLEQTRAWMRRLVPPPPIYHLTGMVLNQVAAGSASGSMPASPWLQTADGTVEYRLLMEAALGLAVLTGAPPGHAVQAACLTVNPLRPCTLESGVLLARARTVNSGPRFTLAEVLVEDGVGRAVAHGTGTYLVRPIEPPPPPYRGTDVPAEMPRYPTPDPYQRPVAWSLRDVPDEMTFLEFLRSLVAGDVQSPPVLDLLGLRGVDADEGMAAGTMVASRWLCNRTEEIMPGAIASLFHHLLTAAAMTLGPLRHRLGVLDQTVSFLDPVPADGRELTVQARATHRRPPFVLCRAEVTDPDGNVVAVAHQTALISPPRDRPRATEPERSLATVLFTDIVGSTRRAEELGDSRWRQLLDEHHAGVRRELARWKGREVKTTGDGFLATFDSPGRAVQCARAIRDALRALGLEVRIGLHTGECELSGADVAGIAVHLASRIQAQAAPGEILLSGTVHDLVAGSGLRFADRGRQALKGIDGEWQLFALEGE